MIKDVDIERARLNLNTSARRLPSQPAPVRRVSASVTHGTITSRDRSRLLTAHIEMWNDTDAALDQARNGTMLNSR